MNARVNYRCADGVATITMNDGKVNVMSGAMLHDLDRAFDQAARHGAITVLRSTRPGIFSAGFDLKVFAANEPMRSHEMVKAGAELALRVLTHPFPTIGVMEGHAFPMGTFLLLGCDVRIGARGPFRMGLNEVAIGITPPTFAVELARSRLHPAWLSRTVTLGEMVEPDDAVTAGFLDRVVAAADIDAAIAVTVASLSSIHLPSHTAAKQKLRLHAVAAIRGAIDSEITLAAYEANAQKTPTVRFR
jgi:enoyl-CoA hydratase